MVAYTMYNSKVIPAGYKPKMVEYSIKNTEETTAKVSVIKTMLHELLMAKKHLMDFEEKIEFLAIYDELYAWLNDMSNKIAIEVTVSKAVKVLKSYGRVAKMP